MYNYWVTIRVKARRTTGDTLYEDNVIIDPTDDRETIKATLNRELGKLVRQALESVDEDKRHQVVGDGYAARKL